MLIILSWQEKKVKLLKYQKTEKVTNITNRDSQIENLQNEKQANKIMEYRDIIFDRIINEVRKYYHRTIKGNYRYAGMPEIKGGVRG